MLVNMKNMIGRVVAAALLCSAAWAQAPAGPQWKDRAEYDLVQSIQQATDLKKKVELLNQWKEKYAATDFGKVRAGLYVDTYEKLKDIPNLIIAANELVAADPKDVNTLVQIAVMIYRLGNTSPEVLELMNKTAATLLANVENKPANLNDEQWKAQKPQMIGFAHRAQGWVAQQKKDFPAMQAAYLKSLEANPAQADLSYLLGQEIIKQKDEKTYFIGLFHIARAGVYDGPGAMGPKERGQVETYFGKAYAGFHGSAKGADEVKALAKASPIPPADFKILSVKEIAEAEEADRQKLAASDPSLAIWKGIQDGLKGEGQAYFDEHLKEAQIENLRGYLVEQRAKELVLAMSGKEAGAEVTLVLDAPMAGKAEPGTELRFSAVPSSFTKDPFMLTMSVEKKDIKGWPTPAAKKPAAGAKKPGAAKRKPR